MWRSESKLQENPGGMAATVSLEVCTKMVENRTQDEHFKCQFEKNGGFAVFLTVKPSILLQNSGLGLRVTQA